jgi:transcriptional regulator with XRE-family HTH domain
VRSQAERDRVRELVAAGLNDCEIARATGIPRGTVRDWRRGKLRHERAQTLCAVCAGTPDRLPAANYAYVLGAYLGDGYIVHTRRGVYQLRVACDLLQINIAWWIALAIGHVRGRRGALQPRPTSSVIDVSSYWKHWPWSFPSMALAASMSDGSR